MSDLSNPDDFVGRPTTGIYRPKFSPLTECTKEQKQAMLAQHRKGLMLSESESNMFSYGALVAEEIIERLTRIEALLTNGNNKD